MKSVIAIAEQILPLAEEVLSLKRELDAFEAEWEKPRCTQSDLEDWTDAAQQRLEYSWERRDREDPYLEKKKELEKFLTTTFDGSFRAYNYGISLWYRSETCPENDKDSNDILPFYKAGALYQAVLNVYADEWVDVQLLAYVDKTDALQRLDEILAELF